MAALKFLKMMNNASSEHFRHELKFIINEGEHDLIASRLGPICQHDSHAENGQYLLRSLYFDDYWHSAYEDKVAGVLERKKYRIRIYNYKGDFIRLERKKKFGSYIYKESAKLTQDEVYKILRGDYEFLLHSKYPLCREFYIECVCHGMRPCTIVDYDREPWIMEEGTVRITFDKKIRAAIGSFDIFDPTLPVLAVSNPGEMVLEVKFTEFLPKIVQQIIPPQSAEQTAYSKFVLCYEKSRYRTSEEYWFSEGSEMPYLARKEGFNHLGGKT